MNTASKLIALALLGSACGPGGLHVDTSTETSTDDSTTSASSSSSETGTSETSTSETGTTQTSTTTQTTDPNETVGFIPEDEDMWGAAECDSFAQDCPDGEKCVPYASSGSSWDANKCVPIMGDQAPGEPCIYAGAVESTDDCDASSFCWNVMEIDGQPVGTCTPFCAGTADRPECPEGSSCLVAGDGPIALCISSCDPILQDCNDGLACYWEGSDFNCVPTTQDIPPGDPCGFINDCAEGNICMSADALPSCADAACCSPWCLLGAGDQPCDVLPGTACVPFFEDGTAPPGYEHIGVCLLPP